MGLNRRSWTWIISLYQRLRAYGYHRGFQLLCSNWSKYVGVVLVHIGVVVSGPCSTVLMESMLRSLMSALLLVALPCTVGSDQGHHYEPPGTVLLASLKRAEPTLPLPSPSEPIEYLSFAATQHDVYDHIILAAARERRLDPFILKALLYTESKFNPKAESPKGAIGVAQFAPSGRGAVTRIRRIKNRNAPSFTHNDALDPAKAIPAAAELLEFFRDRYGLLPALNAYNTGKPYMHVRGFILNIVRVSNQYRVFGGLPPVKVCPCSRFHTCDITESCLMPAKRQERPTS